MTRKSLSITFFALGAIAAVPALNASGVSASYLLFGSFAFIALLKSTRIPKILYVLLLVSTFIFFVQMIFPVGEDYFSERFRWNFTGRATKFSQDSFIQNSILYLKLTFSIITPIIVMIFAKERKLDILLIKGFIFGAIISSIYGFLNLRRAENSYFATFGLASGPTTFGLISTLAFILVQSEVMTWRSIFRVPLLAIFSMSVLLSGSRGALLTLAVCSFIGFISKSSGGLVNVFARLFTAIFVSFLPIIVFASGVSLNETYLGQFRALTNSSSPLRSNLLRENLRNQGLADFYQNPLFGVGFRVLNEAHFVPLQLLASGGILLFLVFFSLYLRPLRFAFSSFGASRALSFSLLSYVTMSFLTQNQVDLVFVYLPLAIFYSTLDTRHDPTSLSRSNPIKNRSRVPQLNQELFYKVKHD